MLIRTGLYTLLALAPSALAQSVASAAVISFKVEGTGASTSGAAAATSSAAAGTTSATAQALTISMNVAGSQNNLTAAASTQASTPLGTIASSSLTAIVSSAVASASSAAASATSAASSAGSQNVWVMKVGSANGSLTFSPDSISGAKAGDMVQFQFYPRNHSVALGDYTNACAPATNATNDFFSGFMPTSADGQLTYTVAIKDTNPMWLYCTQGMHCQDGMVGVINPPTSGQTLADYKARAAKAANNITPQSSSSSGTGTGSSPSTSASGTGAGTGSSPSISASGSGAGGGAASSSAVTGSPIATGATPSGPTTSPAKASTNESSTIFQTSSWGLLILAAIVSLTF